MGCYLSAPDDRVFVTEGQGKNFRYSTASCQGWRREQEDAEDCLPNFDDDASLFILCDGHGGPEVAKYTAKHFPDFLKNHRLYQEGDYKKALEEAFVEFDQTLRLPEAVEELERLAMDDKDVELNGKQEVSTNDKKPRNEDTEMDTKEGPCAGSSDDNGPASSSAGASKSNDDGAGPSSGPSTSAGPSTSNGPTSVAEDVDSETLKRESLIPIEELISKYSGPAHMKGKVQSLRHGSLKISGSPVIRSSRRDNEDDDIDDDKDVAGVSKGSKEDDNRPSPSKQTVEWPSSSSESRPELDLIKNAMQQYFKDGGEEEDEEEEDSEFEVSDMSDSDDDNGDGDGDDDDDDDDDDNDDDEEQEFEDSDSDDEDEYGDDEREDEVASSEKGKSKRLRKKHRRPSLDEPNSSNSEDETDDGEADDDDESDEDEDEPNWEVDQFGSLKVEAGSGLWKQGQLISKESAMANRVHRPGTDSGCTVVVALIKAGTLYVASAGDSRCIVIMRDGRHKAMSFDHKPEDEKELKRIKAANGTVIEGRVNGGLNLSRAFGDFNYKDIDLDPRKQIITPLPDVISLRLDFHEVEYIFLACDGIWNSMNNARVAKFIRLCRNSLKRDLVQTCVELFRKCLAPGVLGDGTGCDNMTCILVKYYIEGENIDEPQPSEQKDLNETIKTTDGSGDNIKQEEQQHSENNYQKTNDDKVANSTTGKRAADSDDDTTGRNMQMSKRRCFRLLDQ